MISEEIARRERLHALKEASIDPYPAHAERTHHTKDALHHFDALEASKDPISLAGRARTIRKHGGLTFITLEDATGRMQVVLHRDVIGLETYDAFHAHADMGDFFSFSGPVFRTKRGEPSLDAHRFTVLSKSLLPLPEKFHGLTDTETRYRQRYLDLLANEETMVAAKTRAQLVRAMRTFLEHEGFLEVETPILQPIAGGATARPFVTHHNTLHHDFFLRIAPELYLKRLIVGGFEKIYEYARCFRNEGISPQHNPEFTQIEAYWAYATIEDLVDHIERMLTHIVPEAVGSTSVTVAGTVISFAAPFKRHTFHDIVLSKSGIDLDLYIGEEALRIEMEKRGIKTDGVIGEGELVDHLYKEAVRPHIIQPTFITEYPASMKPLAKCVKDAPRYSASAQLVVMGLEVWNAFNELNDPLEQEERFREQEALRERGNEDAQRVDEDYLTALKHGMPPTAGYGIGIDRLAMLLTGNNNLKEIILFPTLKPADALKSPETKDL